jgi:Ca2+-binding EF-hand superfamily protein
VDKAHNLNIFSDLFFFFALKIRLKMMQPGNGDKPASSKNKKKRINRHNSNVFAMFDQKQISELKEAFSMIDNDNDGFIDKEDLKDTLYSLGQNPTEEELDSIMSEAPGSLNFTMFLTLMGEKRNGTDPEHEIIQAFECFDDDGNHGFINADKLREYLTTMGDRFTEEEVDIMYKGIKLDEHGNFSYRDFVKVLKYGE